jgi:hypothetical protein
MRVSDLIISLRFLLNLCLTPTFTLRGRTTALPTNSSIAAVLLPFRTLCGTLRLGLLTTFVSRRSSLTLTRGLGLLRAGVAIRGCGSGATTISDGLLRAGQGLHCDRLETGHLDVGVVGFGSSFPVDGAILVYQSKKGSAKALQRVRMKGTHCRGSTRRNEGAPTRYRCP